MRFATPLSVLATVVALGGLLGCDRKTTSPANQSHDDILVSVIGPETSHPRWPGLRGGAARYLRDAAVARATYSAPASDNPAAFADAVRAALRDRPNVACLFATTPEAAEAGLAVAADKHVPAVVLLELPGDVRVYGRVLVDWTQGAALLADSLATIVPDRLSYVLIHAASRDAEQRRLYDHFMTRARQQTALALLTEVDMAVTRETPQDALARALGEFRHAGLVVTLDPNVWLATRAGWEAELRASNAAFRFATLSTAPVLWAALGTAETPGTAAALVGPLDGEIGYAAMQIAVHAAFEQHDAPQRKVIPCELVTPATLADFAARYSKAANDLDVSEYLPPTP